MISLVISFLLGIVALQYFADLPSFNSLIGLCMLGALFLGFRLFSLKCLGIFLIGFAWCGFQASGIIQSRLPNDIENKPLEILGTIQNLPALKTGGVQLKLKVDQTFPKSLWPKPGSVLLWIPHSSESFKIGEKWRFFVILKRPHAYSNPGSFDLEKQFFQNRIMAKGTVVKGKPLLKIQEGSKHFEKILSIRALIQQKLRTLLAGKPFLGVIQALIIGVQDDIEAEQWSIFKKTGTAHLVAISGLHIGLVAGFVFWGSRRIYSRWFLSYGKVPAPVVGAYLSAIAAIFYAFLAGLSIPTQRALMMVVLWAISLAARRWVLKRQIYFLSLLGVLVYDPLAVLSVGFWLSFGAVGILLYGMRGYLSLQGIWNQWGRAQWVVFMGLLPMTLAAFNLISLLSPLANLIAIPWVSFIVVPCSLGGTLLSVFNIPGGLFLLAVAHRAFSILNLGLEKLSQIPLATFSASISVPALIAGMIGALIFLMPRGFPARILGWFWWLPLMGSLPSIEAGRAHLTVLDVGQGLACVVQTAKHVLIFDTGPKWGSYRNAGEQIILPYLSALNLQKIDTLIISHNDSDHIGGAKALIEHIPIQHILMGDPAPFLKRGALRCQAGQHWMWDGVRFEILHPGTSFLKKNDHACVLKVTAGADSALLTADIEALSEAHLLEHQAFKLRSTVLVVPHHGSQTSSTLPFIQAVAPHYGFLSYGYLNRYGHPHASVVKRYEAERISLFNTVEHGALSFELGGLEKHPKSYRETHLRYWSERPR